MGGCGGRPNDAAKEEDTKLLHEDHFDLAAAIQPTNLGKQAQVWLEKLALPLPVSIALLCGGCLGSRVGFRNFVILMVLFFGITPVIYHKLMGILGRKVKAYIQEHDQDYLGVDVWIDEIEMCLCYARFTIKGFTMMNPKGYNSEYLMKCNAITLDLDLLELVKSKAKQIVVEEFTLDNIDVIVEYDSIILGAGKSNVDWVLDFMSNRNKPKDGEDDQDSSGKDSPNKDEKPKSDSEEKPKENGKDGEEKKPGRQTTIHKVAIIDVGARMQANTGLGQRAAVADMRYSHFSQQFKSTKHADLFGILLKSIMKSILTNVAGKAIAQKAL